MKKEEWADDDFETSKKRYKCACGYKFSQSSGSKIVCPWCGKSN